jgi:hypothetical protein
VYARVWCPRGEKPERCFALRHVPGVKLLYMRSYAFVSARHICGGYLPHPLENHPGNTMILTFGHTRYRVLRSRLLLRRPQKRRCRLAGKPVCPAAHTLPCTHLLKICNCRIKNHEHVLLDGEEPLEELRPPVEDSILRVPRAMSVPHGSLE